MCGDGMAAGNSPPFPARTWNTEKIVYGNVTSVGLVLLE
jgi:hypothetical protein